MAIVGLFERAFRMRDSLIYKGLPREDAMITA